MPNLTLSNLLSLPSLPSPARGLHRAPALLESLSARWVFRKLPIFQKNLNRPLNLTSAQNNLVMDGVKTRPTRWQCNILLWTYAHIKRTTLRNPSRFEIILVYFKRLLDTFTHTDTHTHTDTRTDTHAYTNEDKKHNNLIKRLGNQYVA